MIRYPGISSRNSAIGMPRDTFELREWPYCPLINSFPNLRLRPPLLFEDRHVFRAQYQHPVTAEVDCSQHGISNRSDQPFTGTSKLTVHKMWSLASKDCNCADFSRYAALNAKRLPGITYLVFRDTVAILTRMTDAGLIDDTGNRPAYIHENQADSPSDGGIGAYSWSKAIDAAIYVELLHCRAIHN